MKIKTPVSANTKTNPSAAFPEPANAREAETVSKTESGFLIMMFLIDVLFQ